MVSCYHLSHEASEGFKDADSYDTHRPAYPPEAVEALLKNLRITNRPNLNVVEIACGTGKFTEALAARHENFNIMAVEPHKEMREQLVAKRLRDVDIKEGCAESMPVGDEWGDACVAAQAFHWFATDEALAEIHRVLKPSAVFGMIWNIDDYNKPKAWNASTEWEQKLNDWVHSLGTNGDSQPRFRDMKWQEIFSKQLKSNPLQVLRDTLTNDLPRFSVPIGQDSVKWTQWLSEEALWSRINTLSHAALLEGEAREAGVRVFKEALLLSDVERNENGEIACHGNTFFAWTDRM